MRDAIWFRTLEPSHRAALLASDPLPRTAGIVVVGAGLVGLCTAAALRRRGERNIVVLERGEVCGEASGASAGGLWPAHESRTLGEPELAARADELHRRLRAEFPCDYMPSGLVSLLAPADLPRARQRVASARRAGFAADLIEAGDVVTREPGLRHQGPALHFPEDGSLHPLKLAAGLVAWLRAHGVRICLGTRVARTEPDGSAVETDRGGVAAAAVAVTAGAWTPLLTGLLGWEPPIRPVRGTLVATEPQVAGTIRSIVIGPRYYYWQLGCGPLAGGGSEEDVGFRRGVDERVVEDIRAELGTLFPGLCGLRISCRWSGFRPRCADGQPVIGRVPGLQRVYVAAGHFRKGILLAPLSGELLADEILEGRLWPAAATFRPDRFAGAERPM